MLETSVNFDISSLDINWTAVILIASFLIVMPLQIWFCYKAKRTAVRLLPSIILTVLALVLALIAYLVGSWEGLFILLLALYIAFIDVVCIMGVFIGFFIKYSKNRKE